MQRQSRQCIKAGWIGDMIWPHITADLWQTTVIDGNWTSEKKWSEQRSWIWHVEMRRRGRIRLMFKLWMPFQFCSAAITIPNPISNNRLEDWKRYLAFHPLSGLTPRTALQFPKSQWLFCPLTPPSSYIIAKASEHSDHLTIASFTKVSTMILLLILIRRPRFFSI